MKRLFTILSMVSMISLTMLWQGCEADVDLSNIDTTVEVKASLATPIGSIKASIGNFVGDGTWSIYVDTLKNHGVLTLKDTFSVEGSFHQVDLSQYISSAILNMNIYDKLKASGMLLPGDLIVGTGIQVPLQFPLTMKLSGINNNQSYQRLDSALIKNASFVSTITPKGNLPIKWEWIDKVVINLGEAFHRPAGNSITVYEKGGNYQYGQAIPINVDEFSLNLMKNKKPNNWQDYTNNVIDSCTFDITMYVTIPKSASVIQVPKTAALQYQLGVQFIDYHAIWGMFQPSDDMSNSAVVKFSDLWEGWNQIPNLCLPFSDPSIDVSVTTQIAGALLMNIDYVYTSSNDGKTAYAEFFDGRYKSYTHRFPKEEYLSLESPIGTSTTMRELKFNKLPEHGRIDQLFSIRPDKLAYKYSIGFDESITPQLRITDNTSIRVDAACELPMMFNEGVSLSYAGTIGGIDLSAVSLDAMLDELTILDTLHDASAKLVLAIENSIPLEFKAVLSCLDENGNVILDPETQKPFSITDKDTIVIAAPQFDFVGHEWKSTPDERVYVIEVDREKLEVVKTIKQIAYNVSLDDQSLHYAYEKGLFNVKLTDDNYLRIKIAVGASVDAVLDLELN